MTKFVATIMSVLLIVAYCHADYWMYAASAQDVANLPSHSHTFATFIKTDDTGKEVERQTISWMPRSMNIAVWRRIPEPGVNLTIPQTLAWAKSVGADVKVYGPYRITEDLYNRSKQRVKELESGRVQYMVLDRRHRPYATNCIHAVADVYTDNGMLLTGTSRGDPATRSVLTHLRPFIRNK